MTALEERQVEMKIRMLEKRSTKVKKELHELEHLKQLPKQKPTVILKSKWYSMVTRCHNPRCKAYKYYGGRGIAVCEEWRGPAGFKTFFQEMSPTFSHGLTLERINNNKGYSKENCTWATMKQQLRNRRNVKLSVEKARKIREFHGKTPLSMAQLAKVFNVSKSTIAYVLNKGGWPEPTVEKSA